MKKDLVQVQKSDAPQRKITTLFTTLFLKSV